MDHERLQRLVGARSYDELRRSHREWIDEYPGDATKGCRSERTEGIAACLDKPWDLFNRGGSKPLIEKVKALSGLKAKGADVIEGGEGYHPREEATLYRQAPLGALNYAHALRRP